jgi:hypothetical protein
VTLRCGERFTDKLKWFILVLMKRLHKKQMNKRPNKKRRVLFIWAILLIVTGLLFGWWYSSQQGVGDAEYENILTEVQQNIDEQDYSAAESKLAKLEKSGGDQDYRVYAAYADIANYKKDSEKAKMYAERTENLYSSAKKIDIEISFRVESYLQNIYVPHEKETNSDYVVPKEKSDETDFQG